MKSQTKSYEQRQASKKFFMKVTVLVVGFALLLGVIGSAGISAIVSATQPQPTQEMVLPPAPENSVVPESTPIETD